MFEIFLLLCFIANTNYVLSYKSFHNILKYKNNQVYSTNEKRGQLDSPIWSEEVEYIDLTASDVSTSPTSRNLPLFLLSSPFYPEGLTYLHVFEMKYRTMMFDITNSDKLFGYIHTDPETGRIAKVGTLCKITSTDLLEDGRQFIELEGVGRFTVRKIVKTLPYVVADVEVNLKDNTPDDVSVSEKLEIAVYDALKYYIRLLKTLEPQKELVISQAARRTRPTKENIHDLERRTSFSFSIANMVQMSSPKESQLLLQTTDIIKRLEAEKSILTQAGEVVSEKLIKLNQLTATQRDEIKMKTYTSDYEDDILPAELIEAKESTETDEWDISNVM